MGAIHHQEVADRGLHGGEAYLRGLVEGDALDGLLADRRRCHDSALEPLFLLRLHRLLRSLGAGGQFGLAHVGVRAFARNVQGQGELVEKVHFCRQGRALGIGELAGNATMLYYMTDEAQEGKNAFLEKRKPDWDQFPKLP